jgi:ABC-2 type transport system ATP-binding protein
MLAQTGLEDRADEEVGRLSGGNQQRVNIAIGLLSEPPALLLDEPSASLDPRQRERLWEFIGARAGHGTTIVFSTHNVAEAEHYARKVLVLGDGELLFTGTPEELERAVNEPGLARDLDLPTAVPAPAGDFETAFVRFLRARGH